MPYKSIFNIIKLKNKGRKINKFHFINKNKEINLFENRIDIIIIKFKNNCNPIYITKYSLEKILKQMNLEEKDLFEFLDLIISNNKLNYNQFKINKLLGNVKNLKQKIKKKEKELIDNKEYIIQNNNNNEEDDESEEEKIIEFPIEKLDKYNRGKSEKIKMVEILNEEDIDKIETLNINKIEREYCHTRSSTLDDFDFLRIDNLERPIVIRRVIYRVFKYKIKKKK